jgi:hypothetical protein
MKQRFFWILMLGAALSTSALAQGNSGNAHGKGHGKGNPHNAQGDDRDRDQDRDGDGWEVRNGWEYRNYQPGQNPPGWSKGKKTGWGNCNLPPGQAKKYGCNQYRYQGRDYYWYKDDGGRIIVRRPSIHVHGDAHVGF